MNKFLVFLIAMMTSMAANARCIIEYDCDKGIGEPVTETIEAGSKFKPAENACFLKNIPASYYLVKGDDEYIPGSNANAFPGVDYTIQFTGQDGVLSCDYADYNAHLYLSAQYKNETAFDPNSVSATSVSYVDSQLATRQPVFTGSATSKLILFPGPNDVDGAVGSRDIVESLGTPNANTGQYSGLDLTSTEIPTGGAVAAGLNKKQKKVSGVANNVVTYTTSTGTFGVKPIYKGEGSMPTALIEAQTLNSAVADAVNSEFIRVDENGKPDPNGTLWRINSVNGLVTLPTLSATDLLSALVNAGGQSGCYKRLKDGTVTAGKCTTMPSQYGDWGVMLKYNEGLVQVSGISACSSVDEGLSMGDIPTHQSDVQADYESNIAAAPTNSPVGEYCYCKLTDPETSDAHWVFSQLYSSAGKCAASCASSCGSNVLKPGTFRQAIFGISE